MTGWAEFGQTADLYKDYGMWIIGSKGSKDNNDDTRQWAANGGLSADLEGQYLTHTKYGSLTGQMVGTHSATDDEAKGTWQATSQGYWEKEGEVLFSSQFRADNIRVVKAEFGYGENGESGATYEYGRGLDGARVGESLYNSDSGSQYTGMEWQGPLGIGMKDKWTYHAAIADDPETLLVNEAAPEYYSLASTPYVLTRKTETDLDIGDFDTALASLASAPDGSGIDLTIRQGYQVDDGEDVTGILAGLDANLWTSGSPLMFMLRNTDFEEQAPLRIIRAEELLSFDPTIEVNPWTNSTLPNGIGGAYHGFLGGAVDIQDGVVDDFYGMFSALYYNSNEIGILYAPLAGEVYQSLGAVVGESSANLIPYVMGSVPAGTLSPVTFASQSVYSRYQDVDELLIENYWTADGTGGLPGKNIMYKSDGWENLSGAMIKLQDQDVLTLGIMYYDSGVGHMVNPPWTIWQSIASGIYNVDTVTGKYPQAWDFESVLTDNEVTGTSVTLNTQPTANGYVEGTLVRYDATWNPTDNPSGMPFTSIAGGEVKGLFDPGKTTWQMIAQGAGMETTAFLAKAGQLNAISDETERANALQAFYNTTKIPCFQVGSTDLRGNTITGDVNVSGGTINLGSETDPSRGILNATFFAPSTGARPQVWASGTVNGSYTGTPTGGTVGLSGYAPGSVNQLTNGITADFNLQHFNTTWGATVTNGNVPMNSLTGASGYTASNPVGFQGGAAGIVLPDPVTPQYGTFNGTAAGIVTPPLP